MNKRRMIVIGTGCIGIFISVITMLFVKDETLANILLLISSFIYLMINVVMIFVVRRTGYNHPTMYHVLSGYFLIYFLQLLIQTLGFDYDSLAYLSTLIFPFGIINNVYWIKVCKENGVKLIW